MGECHERQLLAKSEEINEQNPNQHGCRLEKMDPGVEVYHNRTINGLFINQKFLNTVHLRGRHNDNAAAEKARTAFSFGHVDIITSLSVEGCVSGKLRF